MNFHDADFLYSISQEHIKYTSIVLKWTCLSWREDFFVCTGPAFRVVLVWKILFRHWTRLLFLSHIVDFFICFYIMKLKIRNLSLHQTKRIDLSGTVAQKRWTKIQFKDPLYPTYEPWDYFNNYRDFLFHTGTTVVAIAKKTLHFMPRLQLWFFPLMFHVRMKQIRGL